MAGAVQKVEDSAGGEGRHQDRQESPNGTLVGGVGSAGAHEVHRVRHDGAHTAPRVPVPGRGYKEVLPLQIFLVSSDWLLADSAKFQEMHGHQAKAPQLQ